MSDPKTNMANVSLAVIFSFLPFFAHIFRVCKISSALRQAVVTDPRKAIVLFTGGAGLVHSTAEKLSFAIQQDTVAEYHLIAPLFQFNPALSDFLPCCHLYTPALYIAYNVANPIK